MEPHACSGELTTAYTPHSNDAVESQNRIMITIARTTLEGMGNTWNQILPFIQFHMNKSYVSSIGMTYYPRFSASKS